MSRYDIGKSYTLFAFSKRYGLGLRTLHRAEKNSEIRTVSFGGKKRIPPDEVKRLEEFWGLKPLDQPQAEPKTDE